MKTKTGLSLGLALTLMVGVFATMLALGLFTTPHVGGAKIPTQLRWLLAQRDRDSGTSWVDCHQSSTIPLLQVTAYSSRPRPNCLGADGRHHNR